MRQIGLFFWLVLLLSPAWNPNCTWDRFEPKSHYKKHTARNVPFLLASFSTVHRTCHGGFAVSISPF